MSPRISKLVALVLSIALVAAACGGSDDEGNEPIEDPSSSSLESGGSGDSEPEREAEPVGPIFPLTGESLNGEDAPTNPAVVIKVSNNDAVARAATKGLESADIIYEERIEANATRFAVVFHSKLPDEVGSVRSGRTSDIDIISNLNQPIFGFSGANQGVQQQLRQAENDNLLVRSGPDFGNAEFRRIDGFSAPNNLVADTGALASRLSEEGSVPTPVFDYGTNADDLGEETLGVRVDAATPGNFLWDEESGTFLRFAGTDPHITRDENQLAPTNVLVLITTYLQSQIDSSSRDAQTIGSGRAVLYTGGVRIEGTWTRDFARDGYTLTTDDGTTMRLAPGQTWVSLTPEGTESELTTEQAAALTPAS